MQPDVYISRDKRRYSMFLQNDMELTIIVEADGKHTILQPGENMQADDIRVVHIYPSPPFKLVEGSANERLKALIMRVFDVPEEAVVPQADFVEDFHSNVVGLVRFIMEMEEEFGVHIDGEEAEKMFTVEGAQKYLEDKGIY
jgi:acyl carrier protein